MTNFQQKPHTLIKMTEVQKSVTIDFLKKF